MPRPGSAVSSVGLSKQFPDPGCVHWGGRDKHRLFRLFPSDGRGSRGQT